MHIARLSANIVSSNDNEGRVTWLWDDYESNQQGYQNIIITKPSTANPCACIMGFMVSVNRQVRGQSFVWPIHYADVIMAQDCVSNHQRLDCLFSRLFRHRSKKTAKLRVTGLCAENSPVTGEFPAQMANNAENVSIWWRHHGTITLCGPFLSGPSDDKSTQYIGAHWSTSHCLGLWMIRLNNKDITQTVQILNECDQWSFLKPIFLSFLCFRTWSYKPLG